MKALRASAACQIVNLDRAKFNDAVARGAYPCAPPTRPGSARHFTDAELLPLYFFARLVEHGFRSEAAGRLAYRVHDAVTNGDDYLLISDGVMNLTFHIGNVREIIAEARRTEETRQ